MKALTIPALPLYYRNTKTRKTVSCHSNESTVCCTSVACVDDLLCSLEELSRGVGIDETSSAIVLQKYKDKKEAKLP